MQDFFAAVEHRWPKGQEDYHWLVLPGDDESWSDLAEPYQELTLRAGIQPVRIRWLHVTVGRVAPAGAVSDAALRKIVAVVRERCLMLHPFALSVGRPEAWRAGIVRPLRPGHDMRRVAEVTTSAAREITDGRYPAHVPTAYVPHLTIGYAVERVDDKPVRAWLADSDRPDSRVSVTELAMVAQSHDGREITWRVIDRVPFAGDMPITQWPNGQVPPRLC